MTPNIGAASPNKFMQGLRQQILGRRGEFLQKIEQWAWPWP